MSTSCLSPESVDLGDCFIPIAPERHSPIVDVDQRGRLVAADLVHFDAILLEPRFDRRSTLFIAAAGGMDHDAVILAQASDRFAHTVNRRIRYDFGTAPTGSVRMNHTVKVKTDRAPCPLDPVLFGQLNRNRARPQDAVDRARSLQPGLIVPWFVVPDARIVRQRVMPARQP